MIRKKYYQTLDQGLIARDHVINNCTQFSIVKIKKNIKSKSNIKLLLKNNQSQNLKDFKDSMFIKNSSEVLEKIETDKRTIQTSVLECKRHHKTNLITKSIKNMNRIKQLNKQAKQINSQGFKHKVSNKTPRENIQLVQIISEGRLSCVYLVKVKGRVQYFAMKKLKTQQKYDYKLQNSQDSDSIQVNQEVQQNSLNSSLKMYRREILNRNPCLIKVHSIYKINGQTNILMDYFPLNLKQLIQRNSQPINQIVIKMYLFQLLRGIMALHALKITHRNIEPSNILIKKYKLILNSYTSAKTLSAQNFLKVGHQFYRAPQILIGNQSYSQKIDIWSAGCVLAELTSKNKQPFFQGFNQLDQLIKIFRVMYFCDKSFDIIDIKRLIPAQCRKKTRIPQILYKVIQLKDRNRSEVIDKHFQAFFPKQISNDLLLILRRMLQIDPKKRISAAEALCHQFFDDLRDQHLSRQLQYQYGITQNDIPQFFKFQRWQFKGNQNLINKIVPYWARAELFKQKQQVRL